MRKIKKIKSKNISLAILIPSAILLIAIVTFAIYRLFIYPNSKKAISKYLDESFIADVEIIEKLNSFSNPDGMDSIDVAYLAQIKGHDDLQFVVYRGLPSKSGMSFPFLPPVRKKIISDNFVLSVREIIGNYVAETNNLSISNNSLDINLCGNMSNDAIAEMLYEYSQLMKLELGKYYSEDHLKYADLGDFYLYDGGKRCRIPLRTSTTKRDIIRVITDKELWK